MSGHDLARDMEDSFSGQMAVQKLLRYITNLSPGSFHIDLWT